ncbi:MAG: hypothetical protein IT236_14115 [Bacteroidia bacterium]|nr:hypothetical protein [Bacteroidia bacterium]
MKKIFIIITLIIQAKLHAQSKMDWDATHFGINLFQTGNVKYRLGDSSYSKIGKVIHPMASFYGILPEDGWWIYGDASGFLLIAAALSGGQSKNFHASLYEMGAGWSFNNKRPIKLGSFAELKIVMGLGLGSRAFRTIKTAPNAVAVGIYPLEVGSMINIKDRILVLAKFGLQPLVGKEKGGRFFYDIRSTAKLGHRFGLSLTFVRNTYNYQYDKQVAGPNGVSVPKEFREAYRFFNTQFGITFITSN